MKNEIWDAAIIGGGPAGCSAAISLARQGLRVALLEAKTYPHDKMCGEFLSPECSVLLDQLGVGDCLQVHHPVAIHTACLTAADGNAWETRLPGTALGISRKTLDAVLAEQAVCSGVKLFEASTVRELSGNLLDGFELTVQRTPNSGQQAAEQPDGRNTLFARTVIAAHGKRSTLDRALGRQFLKKHHGFIAIKAHFHGPPLPGRIELHAFPGGYCGLSEIEDGARVVCLLVKEEVFQAHRGPAGEGVDRFIDWMKGENLYLRSWLQWADRIHERWISIAQVAFDPKPALERDVLMTGDAAGLIAPLAGNGIAMALDGGMLAAKHLSHFLSGTSTAEDLRRGYPAAWKRRFLTRLQFGRALQPLMLNPKGVSLSLQLFNRLPGVGRFLVSRTRDVQAVQERIQQE